MAAPGAVVVCAALDAPRDPSLDALLGPAAAAGLRAALQARAQSWGHATGARAVLRAATAPDGLAELRDHTGPVTFVSADVPALDLALARDVDGDLVEGVGLVFGPTTDGTPFLVALPSVDVDASGLIGLARDDLFAAAAEVAGGLGLVRSERRLVSAADARALAADPTAPDDLLAFLGAAKLDR